MKADPNNDPHKILLQHVDLQGLVIALNQIDQTEHEHDRSHAPGTNADVDELFNAHERLKGVLRQHERKLALHTVHAHEQNQQLNALRKQIRALANTCPSKVAKQLADIDKKMANTIAPEGSWDNFTVQFEQVHPNFFTKVKDLFGELTPNDLRMVAYMKMGMGNKEIARMCGIQLCTVKSNINRLKKRMDLPADASVRDFILNI